MRNKAAQKGGAKSPIEEEEDMKHKSGHPQAASRSLKCILFGVLVLAVGLMIATCFAMYPRSFTTAINQSILRGARHIPIGSQVKPMQGTGNWSKIQPQRRSTVVGKKSQKVVLNGSDKATKDSFGKVAVVLIGLSASQVFPSGDSVIVDMQVEGLEKATASLNIPSSALLTSTAGVSLLMTCNTTDFHHIPMNLGILKGRPFAAVIDLPRGTHEMRVDLRIHGITVTSSSSHQLRSQQLRLPTLSAALAAEGSNKETTKAQESQAAGDVWDGPLIGRCLASLQCRVLTDFQSSMRAVGGVEWFLTYWTLLSVERWGWFMPWRGDHRWDRGAANPHSSFHMHYTPWKDSIYVGVLARQYTTAIETIFASEAKGAKWKITKIGNKQVGEVVKLSHFLGAHVYIMLFYEDEEKKHLWRRSHLDTKAHRVIHRPFQMTMVDVLDGRYRVPATYGTHLEEDIGIQYEKLYSPDLHNVIVDSTASAEPLKHAPEWKSLIAGCHQLRAGSGASYEDPQMSLVYESSIRELWEVYLCGSSHRSEDVNPMNPIIADPTSEIVVKRKKHCLWEEGVTLMGQSDLDVQRHAMNRFGPDELLVELEGPELHVLRQKHLGDCVYKFPLNVTFEGLYFLRARLLRDTYAAINETEIENPALKFDDLLGIGDVWLRFEGGNLQGSTSVKEMIEGKNLKSCDPLDGQKSGRWVSLLADSGEMYLTHPLVVCPKAKAGIRNPSFRAGGSGRKWLVDPSLFVWMSQGCRDALFGPEMANRCLSRQRILFSGDSHMRTFFNSVLDWSCNITGAAQKGHHTSQCHLPSKHSGWCPSSVLCLEHNMVGWLDSTVSMDAWDVIVLNFGQHSAAGAEHWTVAEYGRWVNAFLDAIAARLKVQQQDLRESKEHSQTRIVWMASSAMVLAKDNMIKASKDWRTNPRLALYEDIAREKVMELQREFGTERVMYLDTYNMTLPMIDNAKGDCGHFLPSNIQNAMVQKLLAFICPSEGV